MSLAILTSELFAALQRYAIIIELFWGDVVFDSFNNASRDEDNILYQLEQICSDFYYDDFKYS